MNVASFLREKTRPEHLRTEAVYTHFNLATVNGYACFLTAQASAFLAVERSLDDAGAAEVVDDWAARRRGDLLRDDLDRLAISDVRFQAPIAFDQPAAILGAIYVLEGSRHGARILRSQVPDGLPTRFMGADGAQGAWRTFLLSLNDLLRDAYDAEFAVAAARTVFGAFESAGLESLGAMR